MHFRPSSFVPALSLSLLGCAHGATHGEPEQSDRHRFDDAQCWAARFEDPSRDAWQKPDQVLSFLGLSEAAKVADIGAATGYFPVRFARAVPKGRVYGVDVETAMVDYLATRARNEELKNLTAVLAAYDDPRIPEAVDLITVVDTYHHIDDRPAYFRRVAASLKPEGRLAIIDFKPSSKMGPREKLSPEMVEAELKEAGYHKVGAGDFLPEQYFLVFAR